MFIKDANSQSQTLLTQFGLYVPAPHIKGAFEKASSS